MIVGDEEEQVRIRAAALKNIEAILAARQRAERELAASVEALARRTEELQQQREWFEVTLASIGDAVITTDVQARVTFLNPVAENMTGWKNAEAREQPLLDVFHMINEDTRERVENPIDKVLATGQMVELANHTALVARDGQETGIEDSAAPIRGTNGAIAGAVMVFHDVSRRRKLDRALRASEQRLRAMFTQAAIGIAVADLDGHFQEANDKFAAILGFSLDELRERTFLQITHPEDVSLTENLVRQLLAGEIESYACEKRYLRKDQTAVWSSTTVTLLRKDGGAPEQFIGFIEDISERKHADELRSRLAAVVESSDDAIISKTLDGIITTWNPGAQHVFGYTAEEVIGKSITLLIPAELQGEEPAILARLRAGERIEHYETTRVRKDGTRIHVSLTSSPVKDSRGVIIGASKIARDITAQKAAEAALRLIDQRKDEFLATLAHELRNPLAPIRHAAMISNAANATDEQKRWSQEIISRQVRHMSSLLDDLLDISRITRGTPELRMQKTSLASVVSTAIETARPLIDEKQHRLLVEITEELVEFSADPLRLSQVLSNLLTNAAKYTDPCGTIRVRASTDAEFVTISVTDTGVGLSKDSLNAVFEMFSQVKATQDRSEGGLGIGLALARALVHLHGGTIEARSEGIGRGSEFIMRIPRRGLIVAEPAQTDEDVGPPPVKRRVLIADDNRDAATSLAMLLELEGHDVTVVHDGRQALQNIQNHNPDVAMLDIGMPEIDGYEVARRARQQPSGRSVMLIAVTGWGQEADRARAMEAGFDLHFTKPVEPETLINLLRTGAPL
ncbi:MAG TPA: PAS domain S-box protein [Steroidobacteraceae bacterium]|nr:PAS domain S-box protein [Steroidobacteraceae bacterium]